MGGGLARVAQNAMDGTNLFNNSLLANRNQFLWISFSPNLRSVGSVVSFRLDTPKRILHCRAVVPRVDVAFPEAILCR